MVIYIYILDFCINIAVCLVTDNVVLLVLLLWAPPLLVVNQTIVLKLTITSVYHSLGTHSRPGTPHVLCLTSFTYF